MKVMLKLWILIPLLALVVTGCGKKADSKKPLEEIQKEVKTMSVKDLEAYSKAYAKELQSAQTDLEKIKSKLSELSPKDLFSDKAKGIKDQISAAGTEVSELTKRYQIYLKEFQAKGGDVSKVKIS